MNLKWLIFALLLLNLPTNSISQLPTFEWNTIELGVSKGDVFEFNLTEFRSYYSENDSYVQHRLLLNWTAGMLRMITPDEEVEVGDSFTITIMSEPYFQILYSNYSIGIQKNGSLTELAIPSFNVSLSHNTFVEDKIMLPIVINGPRPNYFHNNLIDGLFFIPDWDFYQIIYPDIEYNNETVEFAKNLIYRSTFEVYEDAVIYEVESLTKGWEFYKKLIIDKTTGLIRRFEWQTSTDGMSDDEGKKVDRLEIVIENINEPALNTDSSLGQENYVAYSLTSFALLTLLQIRKKKKKLEFEVL